MLNANKLQAAANIIKDSAIEFLANNHNPSPASIIKAIKDGDQTITAQFARLAVAAVKEAEALALDGKISFN